MQTNKSIIVLDALFSGKLIELELGNKFKVGLKNNKLYYEDHSDEMPLDQLSLEAFIRICNKLSDSEIQKIEEGDCNEYRNR